MRLNHALFSLTVMVILAAAAATPAHASLDGDPNERLSVSSAIGAPIPRYEVVVNGEVWDPAGFDGQAVPSCSASDSETKHIVAYQRRRPDGVAVLLCGNSSFGWRHISERHATDWRNIVNGYQLGGSWEDFALWATQGTVGQPVSAPLQPNATYKYTGFIQIREYNSKAVAKSYTVTVPVGSTNDRIVTSYPS